MEIPEGNCQWESQDLKAQDSKGIDANSTGQGRSVGPVKLNISLLLFLSNPQSFCQNCRVAKSSRDKDEKNKE